MTKNKTEKSVILTKRKYFVILMSLILLLAYALFIGSDNLLQVYTTQKKMSAIFPKLSILGMLITILVMFSNLFEKAQQLGYQRVLMFILLISFLFLPITLYTYPIVAGISNAIFNLAEPWRQIFVPPALRATIVGITTALSGFVDIRSTAVEQLWDFDLLRYRQVGIILTVAGIVFWKLSKNLEKISSEISQKQVKPILGIGKLICTYPYIFVICFFSGLNGGIFYYTYFLATQALPTEPATIYQYVIFIGSFFGPVLIGFLADRFGIFFMLMLSGIFLTLIELFIVGIAFAHVQIPIVYYITAFIEAALAATLWPLSASLIGEQLRNQRIFCSFAISNMVFIIGNILCGYIFDVFTTFQSVTLSFAVLNFFLILLVYILRSIKPQIKLDIA